MLAYGIASGRYRRKLWPIRVGDLWRDGSAALTGRLAHDDLAVYNAIQRLLNAGVLALLVVAAVTGLAIWKPVQFRPLTDALGDFDAARLMHFLAMMAIALFLLVHVAMALLVPRSLRAMIGGR